MNKRKKKLSGKQIEKLLNAVSNISPDRINHQLLHERHTEVGMEKMWICRICTPPPEKKKEDDLFTPKGLCMNCHKNKATINWVGEGGFMDAIHGGVSYWCQECVDNESREWAKKQIKENKFIKEELEKIPKDKVHFTHAGQSKEWEKIWREFNDRHHQCIYCNFDENIQQFIVCSFHKELFYKVLSLQRKELFANGVYQIQKQKNKLVFRGKDLNVIKTENI